MPCKVSVIIPVYDTECYLRRCIDSVLLQTFKDIEVILIDDGSHDNSPQICDEYAKKDKRVKVIHQMNQGQANARNKGIFIAEGSWICFVDSDDSVSPNYIGTLYDAVSHTHSKIAICDNFEGVDLPEFSDCKRKELSYKVDELFLYNLLSTGEKKYWVIWGKLIYKDIVQAFPFPSNRIYEDNATVYRWLIMAQRVAIVPQPLYFYFQRKNSTSHTQLKKPFDRLWALHEQLFFYRSCGFRLMESAIAKRFLLASTNTYFELQKEKKLMYQKQLVKIIRKHYYMYCRRVQLSKSERLFIYDAIYPRFMSVYWKYIQYIKRSI